MARKKKAPAASVVERKRGVGSLDEARTWLSERRIEEIECVVPDQAGVARGKIMPVRKFLGTPSMNLPLAVFYQTITGDFPEFEGAVNAVQSDTDIFLTPDFATLAAVPWAQDPTAQVIHDAFHPDGRPVEEAPRQVLRRVLALYAEKGWVPIVAPEIGPLERDDDHYVKTNLTVLRNTTAFNFLDRCAAALPIHSGGDAPASLMIVGETMADRTLLGVAAAIERVLAKARN